MTRVIAHQPTTVYDAAEGDKFNTDTTLTVVSCYTCGVRYNRTFQQLSRHMKSKHPDFAA